MISEERCEETEEIVIIKPPTVVEKHLEKVVGHLIEDEIDELQKQPEYLLKTRDEVREVIMSRLKCLRKGGY